MQKNWIGKSEALRSISLVRERSEAAYLYDPTDTLFGVTFMCIAPTHPLAAELATDAAGLAVVKANTARLRKKRA